MEEGYSDKCKTVAPRDFAACREIFTILQTEGQVIMDLSVVNAAQAQRMLDFIMGAAATVNGKFESIGGGKYSVSIEEE